MPNHRQINTCTIVELDPEPIIIEETGDCSEGLSQKAEVMDSLIKTRMFKSLFETLEFDMHAQREAIIAIAEISKSLGSNVV